MCKDELVECTSDVEEQEDEGYNFMDYLEFLSYDYFTDPEAEKAHVFSGLDRFFIKN